jgi:hypothetical protein
MASEAEEEEVMGVLKDVVKGSGTKRAKSNGASSARSHERGSGKSIPDEEEEQEEVEEEEILAHDGTTEEEEEVEEVESDERVRPRITSSTKSNGHGAQKPTKAPSDEESDQPFQKPKVDKGKGRALPSPSPSPIRSSPSYRRFGEILSDQPDSPGSKHAPLYSDDPLLMGSPGSSTSSLPIRKRRNFKPSSARMKTIPDVEIPLMSVSEIRKYEHPYPLIKPSEATRRRALQRKTHVPEEESEDDVEFLFKAIMNHKQRPVRKVKEARKAPTWRVGSSPSMDGTSEDLGGYRFGDEESEDEGEGSDGLGSDVAGRRSGRIALKERGKGIVIRGTKRQVSWPKPDYTLW